MSILQMSEWQPILGLDCDDTIILIAKNGKEVKVKKEASKISNLIKNAIENDINVDTIRLELVDDDLLEHIVDYMEWHHTNPGKTQNIPFPMYCLDWNIYVKQNKLDQWDFDFIEKFNTHDELMRLPSCVNYLDMNCLLGLAAAKIAQICKKCFEEEKDHLKAARNICTKLGNIWWDEKEDIKAEEEFQKQEKEKEEELKKQIEQKKKELDTKLAEEKSKEVEKKEN